MKAKMYVSDMKNITFINLKGLTLVLACVINYIHYKVWGELQLL